MEENWSTGSVRLLKFDTLGHSISTLGTLRPLTPRQYRVFHMSINYQTVQLLFNNNSISYVSHDILCIVIPRVK